jgi:inosine/xanthosine triphosphate pyrophosphatase family protein
MFLPDGFAITYGEMTAEQRRRVNARAAAMRKLEEAMFGSTALKAGS